jgi:hypothetical protein
MEKKRVEYDDGDILTSAPEREMQTGILKVVQ